MVHICLQAVVGVPPINFEVLVAKSLNTSTCTHCMLHSSSPLKFVIVDVTKILKHGNAGFISLQLLTEAVSISHTEDLAE